VTDHFGVVTDLSEVGPGCLEVGSGGRFEGTNTQTEELACEEVERDDRKVRHDDPAVRHCLQNERPVPQGAANPVRVSACDDQCVLHVDRCEPVGCEKEVDDDQKILSAMKYISVCIEMFPACPFVSRGLSWKLESARGRIASLPSPRSASS